MVFDTTIICWVRLFTFFLFSLLEICLLFVKKWLRQSYNERTTFLWAFPLCRPVEKPALLSEIVAVRHRPHEEWLDSSTHIFLNLCVLAVSCCHLSCLVDLAAWLCTRHLTTFGYARLIFSRLPGITIFFLIKVVFILMKINVLPRAGFEQCSSWARSRDWTT